MNANEIRAALRLRGHQTQSLAAAAGLSGPALHRVISGHARCKRAEEAVSAAIGKTRIEVFGPNKREKGGDS